MERKLEPVNMGITRLVILYRIIKAFLCLKQPRVAVEEQQPTMTANHEHCNRYQQF